MCRGSWETDLGQNECREQTAGAVSCRAAAGARAENSILHTENVDFEENLHL